MTQNTHWLCPVPARERICGETRMNLNNKINQKSLPKNFNWSTGILPILKMREGTHKSHVTCKFFTSNVGIVVVLNLIRPELPFVDNCPEDQTENKIYRCSTSLTQINQISQCVLNKDSTLKTRSICRTPSHLHKAFLRQLGWRPYKLSSKCTSSLPENPKMR